MTSRLIRYVVTAAAVALVAACGSSSNGSTTSVPTGGVSTPPTPHHHHHPTASPTPTTPTTPPTSAAPTPTPTVTVTATATQTTAPVVSRCLSSNLTLSLGISQGTAGSTYQALVFTNNGTTDCELHGYPGVSFVDSDGNLIGQPAVEDPGRRVTRVLAAAGGQANALLRQPTPGNFAPSACQPTTAHRLRVYPPGETVPLFVKFHAKVCTTAVGRTGIGPVLLGNGG